MITELSNKFQGSDRIFFTSRCEVHGDAEIQWRDSIGYKLTEVTQEEILVAKVLLE
jgi:hypothetical protein